MASDMEKALWRAFSTPDGQQTLEFLEKQFSENTLEPKDALQMAYERGQRSVILRILNAFKRGGEAT